MYIVYEAVFYFTELLQKLTSFQFNVETKGKL